MPVDVPDLVQFFCPQFIPMPVLYGVFLYMGVASLGGIQVSKTPNQWLFKKNNKKSHLANTNLARQLDS